MCYKCHKVNFSRGGLYINPPDWITKEKTIIMRKNTDNKCFQFAANVALNYEEFESHPERVSNIKPFITKYDSKGINYPSKIDEWVTFHEKNPITALNISILNKKEICLTYISKNNSNCEKQIILLMIPNEEKEGLRHYLVVKKLFTLLRGRTLKNHGDFCC